MDSLTEAVFPDSHDFHQKAVKRYTQDYRRVYEARFAFLLWRCDRLHLPFPAEKHCPASHQPAYHRAYFLNKAQYIRIRQKHSLTQAPSEPELAVLLSCLMRERH